jgi:hypothetical protein
VARTDGLNQRGGFLKRSRATLALFTGADGRLHAGVVAAFLFVNGLVLVNAVLHDPRAGYDAGEHLSYLVALAANGRTPAFEESRSSQSFTPPLAYVLPALVLRVAAEVRGDAAVLKTDLVSGDSGAEAGGQRQTPDGRRSQLLLLGISAKSAQLLNWVFSVGLTLFVLKICELARPGGAGLKFFSLLTLGMLPVYYKTFSFVRAEPLGAFLLTVAAYHFLRMLLAKDFGVRRALTLGLIIGLAILSRQWSFLILPAFACAALLTWRSRTRPENKRFASALLASMGVAALVGGWFYVSYPWAEARPGRLGSYLTGSTGKDYWTHVSDLSFAIADRDLFTNPVRDALADEVVPIFYSETWGDYWGYFVTDRKAEQPEGLRRYLGRVNLVSLLPTSLLLAGFGLGVYGLVVCGLRAREADGGAAAFGLLSLSVAWSLIGYAYFVAVIPNTGHGTGVKAAYMLQIFPFLSILAAGALEMLGRKSRRAQACAVVLLVCVALHNLPAMVTHHVVVYGARHMGL